MQDVYNRMGALLRTKPEVLMGLEEKMNALTGQEGVFADILRQNDIVVDQTLAGLGLTRADSAETVRRALAERLEDFDHHLYELLGGPDLLQMPKTCGALCELALKVFTPPKGLFLKQEVAVRMLEQYPPQGLVEHFGYTSVKQLIEEEGFAPVMAALRFTQTSEWMHQFFDMAYPAVGPDDFEERDVQLLVLEAKWLAVAEKFLQKKYHNVSHLKEFGVIFVLPLRLQVPGETLRLFSLILHYLHEVPFYADLFRRHIEQQDFPARFASLLRGDVPAGALPDDGKIAWRVVQRYLAKDNKDDFRLFEPHVSPEANHWWHAQEDLGRLSRVIGHDHGALDLGWWAGLDFVGEVFQDGSADLVSFDLIDLLMSLVKSAGQGKYLYHQQEALWNKIFVEYYGRERMEELVREHMIDGFIVL